MLLIVYPKVVFKLIFIQGELCISAFSNFKLFFRLKFLVMGFIMEFFICNSFFVDPLPFPHSPAPSVGSLSIPHTVPAFIHSLVPHIHSVNFFFPLPDPLFRPFFLFHHPFLILWPIPSSKHTCTLDARCASWNNNILSWISINGMTNLSQITYPTSMKRKGAEVGLDDSIPLILPNWRTNACLQFKIRKI